MRACPCTKILLSRYGVCEGILLCVCICIYVFSYRVSACCVQIKSACYSYPDKMLTFASLLQGKLFISFEVVFPKNGQIDEANAGLLVKVSVRFLS